ncbi:glycosyltransferase family 1 protein [Gramella sp. MAR_2010_147]|uniref:glycosyltransferase family 4 protein n=1 Tax=Gramella sp. MAR_2010_147 TaxID=1250205 RepID=UPI00087DB1C7|nr:glycosyltransferase family 1 protein [Gramella sp. MAR_2010_147]SDR66348.1 Glycosyltransferase involved in cell wall bisynthesis [Gramella sp. MAR_2010_147]
MQKKPQIFLESHHLKNQCTGFGQFNYWLIKKLSEQNTDYKLIANVKNRSYLKDFEEVSFHKYYPFTRYKQFYNRKKYDLWHSLNQNTKIEPQRELPYLLTIHDVILMEQNEVERSDKSWIHINDKISRSHAISYISKYAKETTNKYFDIPENVKQEVIYNGNPVQAINPIKNLNVSIDSSKPFLFSIGQFMERKNFHVLVAMIEKLKNFNLVLAGNKDKAYGEFVQQEIEKHHLQNRIFLVGKISEEEKHYYLQNCAAFVFPSLFEGFGLPPIEAMAYGKPVFLAKKTSLPEIGGDEAFYWDRFEPEYMADIFEKGMSRFEENKTDYQNNLKKRANSFDWNHTAAKYLKLYDQILRNT